MAETFDAEATAEGFRRFGRGLQGSSDLYSAICAAIAASEAVVGLMRVTPVAQRLPMLLLAAVHDLLLAGAEHPLRSLYPSLGGTLPSIVADAGPVFVDFCMRYTHELRPILMHRATQTNEIGRVAAIRPLLAELADEGISELALAEFGASAGLNLLVERCSIHYSDGTLVGTENAPIHIACSLRDTPPPRSFLARALPPITFRLGLDQSPVSALDDDATRWLLACVWPDQLQRFRRTKAAIETAQREKPPVVQGRLPDDALEFLRQVPPGPHLCILTTWVLAYLSEDERRALAACVAHVATERDITWILAESPPFLGETGVAAAQVHGVDDDSTMLMTRHYRDGTRTDRAHAAMHGHGTWIRWFDRAGIRA